MTGFVLAAALLLSPVPPEAQLLATEAAGLLPIDDEARLTVTGFQGEVRIQAGRSGELRFRSTRPDQRTKVEIPAALYSHAGTLYLVPPAGDEALPRRLEIAVPAGVYVSVRIDRSTVAASGLAAGLEVRGRELEVDARGCDGPVDLEIAGGTVRAEGLGGDFSLRGSGLAVQVGTVRGRTFADLTEGTLVAGDLQGGAELRTEGVELKVAGGREAFRLEARGGRVEISGLHGETELRLSDAPLVLKAIKGEATVTTDAEVQFNDTEAELHINNYGGTVRGANNKGLVEVITDGATVTLAHIAGPLRVKGNNLTLDAEDVGGEMIVYATGSTVTLRNVAGPLTVENEYGDVSITGVQAKTEITQRQGTMRAVGLNGPVKLQADTRDAVIEFASVPAGEDSTLTNEGGGMTVGLPSTGAFRVEAEARYGRIESTYPWIGLTEAGDRAVGSPSRAGKPVIRILAHGDLVLGPPGAAAPQEAAPAEEEP